MTARIKENSADGFYLAMQAAANRPEPYRAPVSAQPMPVAAPYGGSLLGMARSAPPAPRPTPVNATNWYNAN